MNLKLAQFVTVLGILIIACIAVAREGVKASSPQVKPVEIAKDNIWYTITTKVTNQSDRESVCVTLQALDFQSVEVDHVSICAKVPVNGVRILTKKTFSPLADWKRIIRWQQID